jgi:hypothetical protein
MQIHRDVLLELTSGVIPTHYTPGSVKRGWELSNNSFSTYPFKNEDVVREVAMLYQRCVIRILDKRRAASPYRKSSPYGTF